MNEPADYLRRAWDEAEQAVNATQDPQQALERAAALYKVVWDQLRGRSTDLRKRAAQRIAREQALALSYLASIIGVSKSRAGQLVDKEEAAKAKAARAARKGRP